MKFINVEDSYGKEGDTELRGLRSGSGPSSGNDIRVAALCYMLFPYITHSLRGEITKRNILNNNNYCDNIANNNNNYKSSNVRKRTPFSTRECLHLFGGILDGLIAIHSVHLSHRDVKIKNVMLRQRRDHHTLFTPVLVDLGSAGPLTVDIEPRGVGEVRDTLSSQRKRRILLSVVEDAASNTTMAYQSPELFEGGMMSMNEDEVLDYGKVDVW